MQAATLDYLARRLPGEVFQVVLRQAAEKELLSGKTVGVDHTLWEANSVIKGIVRRDTGDNWQAYIDRLMREAIIPRL